jgi:hypothetical protein
MSLGLGLFIAVRVSFLSYLDFPLLERSGSFASLLWRWFGLPAYLLEGFGLSASLLERWFRVTVDDNTTNG